MAKSVHVVMCTTQPEMITIYDRFTTPRERKRIDTAVQKALLACLNSSLDKNRQL